MIRDGYHEWHTSYSPHSYIRLHSYNDWIYQCQGDKTLHLIVLPIGLKHLYALQNRTVGQAGIQVAPQKVKLHLRPGIEFKISRSLIFYNSLLQFIKMLTWPRTSHVKNIIRLNAVLAQTCMLRRRMKTKISK